MQWTGKFLVAPNLGDRLILSREIKLFRNRTFNSTRTCFVTEKATFWLTLAVGDTGDFNCYHEIGSFAPLSLFFFLGFGLEPRAVCTGGRQALYYSCGII